MRKKGLRNRTRHNGTTKMVPGVATCALSVFGTPDRNGTHTQTCTGVSLFVHIWAAAFLDVNEATRKICADQNGKGSSSLMSLNWVVTNLSLVWSSTYTHSG